MGWLQEIRNRLPQTSWLQETTSKAFGQRRDIESSDASRRQAVESQQKTQEKALLSERKGQEKELRALLDAVSAGELLKEVKRLVWREGLLDYIGWCPYDALDSQNRITVPEPEALPLRGMEVTLETDRTRLGIAVFDIEGMGIHSPEGTDVSIKKYSLNRNRSLKRFTGIVRGDGTVVQTDEETVSYNNLPDGSRPKGLHYLLRSDAIAGELVPVGDKEAQTKVVDFLKRDSQERIINHKLPQDLKGKR